jgi:hypothetical protein
VSTQNSTEVDRRIAKSQHASLIFKTEIAHEMKSFMFPVQNPKKVDRVTERKIVLLVKKGNKGRNNYE